ncbi:MAG: FtsX-like permease family protein [Muribaculaceae bacterium]|nr:FtsX-like permease family protein [Muribaculaceae bacterium]
MNISLFLAKRMSPASGDRKSSPAIKVAVTAVALSVGVMLAAIAVVIGFKREIREKVIGFNSHISMYLASDAMEEENNLLTMTPTLNQFLKEQPFILDFSLELSMPAVLKTSEDFKGIYLKSMNGNHTAKFLNDNLEEGHIPDFNKESEREKIVISRIAANELGLKAGDKIDTYFINDNIKVRRLEVAGIFNSHFDTYDKVMVYGSLGLIQNVAGLKENQGTSVHITTDDDNKIDTYTSRLQSSIIEALESGLLYRHYIIDNVRNQGSAYFSWLELLDTNVIVILTLMTIVAIATLISGMLILILDKKRFIGLTRSLGASIAMVRRVFVYLALKVALIGMAIGNIVMLALLYCQDRYHVIPLDPEAYYIDFVPVEINWWSVLALNAGCFIIIYLSLIIPSRFVAKISPAEAMRDNE